MGTVQGVQTNERVLPLEFPWAPGPLQAIHAQWRYGGSATSCTSGPYNDRDDLAFAVR